MTSSTMRQAALKTRDARLALLELKELVDNATEQIRAAELEMVGLAIGRYQGPDPVKILRAAAETLQSSDFETAISEAKSKMNDAMAVQIATENEPLKRMAAYNS